MGLCQHSKIYCSSALKESITQRQCRWKAFVFEVQHDINSGTKLIPRVRGDWAAKRDEDNLKKSPPEEDTQEGDLDINAGGCQEEKAGRTVEADGQARAKAWKAWRLGWTVRYGMECVGVATAEKACRSPALCA